MIRVVSQPKILGVTLDNMLKLAHSLIHTAKKLQERHNVLKSLAGSTWGKKMETIDITYKATGRSIMNDAVPIRSPQISQTN